jgi:Ca2+-binding RTX toxin-like protein
MVQIIDGTTGPDLLQGDQNPNDLNDRIRGFAGRDTLSGGGGDNTLNGGSGTDTAEYEYTSPVLGPPQQSVFVDLAGGFAFNAFSGSDTLTSIENVNGTSAFGDFLGGNDVANVLNGRGGNDQLRGSDGDDTVNGGAGNDLIEGDAPFSGAGRDRVSGGAGADLLFGSQGADVHVGGGGNDTFRFNAVEILNELVLNVSDHDRIQDFHGAGEPSGAPGQQDEIVISVDDPATAEFVKVAQRDDRITYLVRDQGADVGYLTVESENENGLVVGVDVFFS